MDWAAFESDQLCPSRNLAWEDALLEGCGRGGGVFFLYRNAPCVVIGRNQNPWRETRPETGLPVYRRKSGGGTVYHDAGNLNWSFTVPRDGWSVADALDFVKAAVRRLGVELESDERGALFLEGGKVCGTARRYFGPSVLIHGTLLVSSDLDALRESLAGAPVAGDRAVASVPSPVRNLQDCAQGVSVGSVRDALFAELAERWGAGPPEEPSGALSPEAWTRLEREHESWDWVYGATLPFWVPLGENGAGPFLHVQEGRAAAVDLREGAAAGASSDAGRMGLPREWTGRPFDSELLRTVRGWILGPGAAGRGQSRRREPVAAPGR